MKKALIVTAVAGFIRGFLVSDIKILHSMGYEVHCAADGKNVGADGIQEFFKGLNVIFHQIGFNSKNPFSKDTYTCYKTIDYLLKAENFDVIHAHTPIAGFITRFAANKYRRKGTKVFYTSHGFYFHDKAPKKDWIIYYPLELLASAWSDAIITINNEDYHRAQKMCSKKVFHINGVGYDYNKFSTVEINKEAFRASIGVKPEDIMVLAAGELTDRKNHQVIIKALGKIHDPRFVFVLCGRAMQGTGTHDLLVSLAEENKVRLIMPGFRNDMPFFFHSSDIGVLPSKREGLGMAGIQSLAAGVPLLASNVHGIKDYMVEGKTGFMYDPDDVAGFAEGLKTLSDKQVRESMSADCIAMAQQFRQEVSTQQKMEIYSDLLR